MPGLLALLHQSGSSLQAQQAYSSTVAHNLSNSNTPGYARQRAELAAVIPAEQYGGSYIGRGSILQGVSQMRDRFLEAQMPGALGREKFSATESSVLQGVSALDPAGGLSTALGSFYAAMRSLAQNAGSASYREAAVSSTTQLALSFNRTGQALSDARSGLDDRVHGLVPEINANAAQLAQLNAQIFQARASGGSPNDLLDARQKLADKLAQQVGASPVPDSDGNINLVFAGSVSLVQGNVAATLSTLPNAANGGHLQLLVSPPDGSKAVALFSAPGGELGGLLEARDVALKNSEASVDQLAFDLGTAINTVHTAGFALDGSTGRPLFTMTATAAGAARGMVIDPTVAANAALLAAASSAATTPGDGTAMQALVATENQTLSTGHDAAGTLADFTSKFGAAAQLSQIGNEGDAASLSHLTTMRESVSGVSIDEELVDMQRAQRGYEAVAKVIKTVDDMLSTLMSLR